jgi:hypothetical protein
VSLTNTPDWDGSEKPLVAQLRISSTLGVRAGKRWMLPVHLFEVNRKPLFPGASREHPIYFEHPYREVDEVRVALPAALEVETLPTDGALKLDFAMYTSRYQRESPNAVISVRDLGMNGVFVEPGEYKDVKGFFDKVKAADDQPVMLKAAAGTGQGH